MFVDHIPHCSLTAACSLPSPHRYVSRANPRESSRHTILGTQWYKPREFANQMNVNLGNGWGIVRTIADLCLKQPEGKYVLIKDPNKPVIRLYRVPYDGESLVSTKAERV